MKPAQPELLQRECLHQGFLRIERLQFLQHRFDGGEMKVTREVMLRQPVVFVHTYDPRTQQVVLVEQCRPGPLAVGDTNCFILESPAGLIDADEDPVAAAGRELQEETGLEAIEITPVVAGYVSPGGSSAFAHHLIARVDLQNFEGGSGGLADEHEDIRVHVMGLEQALEKVRQGEIRSSNTILGLYHLALYCR